MRASKRITSLFAMPIALPSNAAAGMDTSTPIAVDTAIQVETGPPCRAVTVKHRVATVKSR